VRTSLCVSLALALAAAACGDRRDREVIASTPASPTVSTTVPAPSPQRARVSGAASSTAGACPSLTFAVAGAAVTTTASTTFDDACLHVVNGAIVDIEGARQSDGSIAASHVTIEQVSVSGGVSHLAGACPSLTFTVAGASVNTSTTTTFSARCADVANGVSVRVDGYQRSDGSIDAALVSRDGKP